MSELVRPTARPIETAITRVHVEPVVPASPGSAGPSASWPLPFVKQSTDHLAIASAVCGITAIVPIISQVMGLGLGIASIVRIRRARRAGIERAGTGWALTGIITSGFALLGWIALFSIMAVIGTSMAGSADSLGALLKNPG